MTLFLLLGYWSFSANPMQVLSWAMDMLCYWSLVTITRFCFSLSFSLSLSLFTHTHTHICTYSIHIHTHTYAHYSYNAYDTGYTSQTFSSLKGVQLCSTLIVRNIYTSDERYSFDVWHHTHTHKHIHTSPLSHTHSHSHTHTHTHTYIHTHTHTHTDAPSWYAVPSTKGKEMGWYLWLGVDVLSS